MESGCAGIGWPIAALGVGGGLDPAALRELVNVHGVSALVDLRVEGPEDPDFLDQLGLRVLHLPTQDCCAVSLRSLCRGVAWVNARLGAGERVYIHCQYGIGRSAALAVCVLISRGVAPAAALTALKQARPQVSPSRAQLQAILRWSRWSRQSGRARPAESLADLGRIAWQPGHVSTGTLSPT